MITGGCASRSWMSISRPGGRPAPGVAPTPQAQPARTRPARGHLRAPPLLRGNRPRPPQPDDGAAPVRRPGRPPARAQHAADGRRLRPRVPGEQPRRRGHGLRARRARHDADLPRAVSGRRGRPSVERADRQPRHVRSHGRHTAPPAGSAPERLPADPDPDGLAPRLANLDEVRPLFLERLRRQADATGDAELRALYEEVRGYPAPSDEVIPDADPPTARPSPIQCRCGCARRWASFRCSARWPRSGLRRM